MHVFIYIQWERERETRDEIRSIIIERGGVSLGCLALLLSPPFAERRAKLRPVIKKEV